MKICDGIKRCKVLFAYNVLAFGIRDLCDVFVPAARFFIHDLIRGVVMTNGGGVKSPL